MHVCWGTGQAKECFPAKIEILPTPEQTPLYAPGLSSLLWVGHNILLLGELRAEPNSYIQLLNKPSYIFIWLSISLTDLFPPPQILHPSSTSSDIYTYAFVYLVLAVLNGCALEYL